MKKRQKETSNQQKCFNIIFEDNNAIIPEIDDSELLTFGLAFMKIRARELNSSKDYSVKNREE